MKQPISHSLLHQQIAKRVRITEAQLKIVDSFFEPVYLEKKAILEKEGDTALGHFYINKGCLKTFTTGLNGNVHILSLAVEDWWAGSVTTQYGGSACRFNIQAIEDSELLLLRYERFEELMEAVPVMERFFRILSQKGLASMQNRILDGLSKDATTRYLNFRENYGYLEARVPQHMIASFLGITPEFLSMIRNKLAKMKVPQMR